MGADFKEIYTNLFPPRERFYISSGKYTVFKIQRSKVYYTMLKALFEVGSIDKELAGVKPRLTVESSKLTVASQPNGNRIKKT